MATEHDENGRKFTALYHGVVTNVADPERLGRVRVRVPGVVEPESDWALPMTNGGGAKGRGIFDVPSVGSDVIVFFHAGEVDRPYYMGGNWGVPGPQRETPGFMGPARGSAERTGDDPEPVDPKDADKVKAWETARWLIVMDDRPGKERLFIRDKKTEDAIELDGRSGRMGISVLATTVLLLKCDGQVTIEGTAITLNGRVVMPTGKPIA